MEPESLKMRRYRHVTREATRRHAAEACAGARPPVRRK